MLINDLARSVDRVVFESSAREFLRDLKARNLQQPLLVVSDGAPGLIRALEEVFPKSLRQRCLAHRIAQSRVQGAG